MGITFVKVKSLGRLCARCTIRANYATIHPNPLLYLSFILPSSLRAFTLECSKFDFLDNFRKASLKGITGKGKVASGSGGGFPLAAAVVQR